MAGRHWALSWLGVGDTLPWEARQLSRPDPGCQGLVLRWLWPGSEFDGLRAEVGWGTTGASGKAGWF